MAADVPLESQACDTEPCVVIEELLNPAAYPHRVISPTLLQTHISWIVLTGEYAYKIKKPLKLDFLDTRTLAVRRFLCEEELRLNRRLAPDLYLDVMPITSDDATIRVGGTGRVIDYAVKMRQFNPQDDMSKLLARGEVSMAEVVRLADSIADFHSTAAPAAQSDGPDYAQQTRKIILDCAATLVTHLDLAQPSSAIALVVDWLHDALDEFAVLLKGRERAGCIRECHGDLHAHNIVRWEGKLTPFDCLEFDRHLRFTDVMNDIAFLIMDLVSNERIDLAYGFLSRYTERTGDYEGIRLLLFYAVHRALVRAMVDALAVQEQREQRPELHRRLQRRINTATAFIQAVQPTLLLMCGPSGSGKSWLSEHLIGLVGAVRIRSDLERKRLPGGELDPAEAYSDLGRGLTYARLLHCAENTLRGGVNTIVDASFLGAPERREFQQLATRLNAKFVIVLCKASRAEMVRRILNRQTSGEDPSEANTMVLDRQLKRFEPLDSDELAHAIEVDTSLPDAAKAAFATLQAREVNLAGDRGARGKS